MWGRCWERPSMRQYQPRHEAFETHESTLHTNGHSYELMASGHVTQPVEVKHAKGMHTIVDEKDTLLIRKHSLHVTNL